MNGRQDDALYAPGQRIGGMHKVVEVLGGSGKTGMGVVYVCERYGGDGLFALKTFQDRFLRHAGVREAFQKEAVINVRLGWHPHTVTANTVIDLDGRPFIDMLYVPPDRLGRRTLADYLTTVPGGEPLQLEMACRWAIEICHGMEHAAALGVSPHQDLKPANVLISEGVFAKVGDFGLARAVDPDLAVWRDVAITPMLGSVSSVQTKHGKRVVGTLPWMSPEHFDGRTDQRSDIYALGIMLFQMVCGHLPYRGADWESAHRTEPVPRFDSPLAFIVHRALAKDPDRRYQTFDAMRQDLEVVYADVAGKVYPSIVQKLQKMGFEQNCLGGWGEAGAIDHLINLATAFHKLGHDDEAEPLLRRALQIKPDSAWAHSALALVVRRRGAIHEAMDHFELAARQTPNDPVLLHNMATTCILDCKYEKAITLLDRALAPGTAPAAILADKALCLERLGNYEQALLLLEDVLKQSPRDPKAWLLKAQILVVGRKDAPRAMEALSEAYRFVATSDDAGTWHELKRRAMVLEKRPEAEPGLQPREDLDLMTFTPLEFPFTVPLPHEREKQLRLLLHDLKRPSRNITSAQLAAAVRGDAVESLPSWAQDPQFEQELENCLKTDVVWICPDCDGIIAFFTASPGEDVGQFARDLLLIHLRDQTECPVCGARSASLYDPEILRYGKQVLAKRTITPDHPEQK